MLARLEEQDVEADTDKQEQKFKFYWKYRREMSDREKNRMVYIQLDISTGLTNRRWKSSLLKLFSFRVLMNLL